jgi:choline dehydrogenase-like flavoprotein
MKNILVAISYLIIFIVIIVIIKVIVDAKISDYPKRYPKLTPTRKSQIKLNPTKYDYIIIGAGTSGSVMAARLSEYNPCATILVLERGKNYSDSPTIFNTTNGATAAYNAPYSTVLTNEASPIPFTVANMMGGGSSHNYGLVVHGTREYYESQFPNLSITQIEELWSRVRSKMGVYALPTSINLLEKAVPFLNYIGQDPNWYNRIKTTQHSLNTYYNVGDLRASTKFSEVLVSSLKAASKYPLETVCDYNYTTTDRVVSIQPELYITPETGLRCSADRAYLNQEFVRNKDNLTLVTGAEVKYIHRGSLPPYQPSKEDCINNILDGRVTVPNILGDRSHADSVSWEDEHGVVHTDRVTEKGKIILCTGAIYSPYLLLKSGFQFEPKLITHYGTTLIFRVPSKCIGGSFSSGPLAFLNERFSPGSIVDNIPTGRDWQLIVGGSMLTNTTLVTEEPKPDWVYVSLLIWMLRPRSRGTIALVSPNNDEGLVVKNRVTIKKSNSKKNKSSQIKVNQTSSTPLSASDVGFSINFPMFSDGDEKDPLSDISQCLQAMHFMKAVFDSVKSNISEATLLFPSVDNFTPDKQTALIADIKLGTTMTDHYTGTCSNIIQPVDAVNPLSTLETKNVYVVDGSSYTQISNGNTEFPILVLAEYAAEQLSKQ